MFVEELIVGSLFSAVGFVAMAYGRKMGQIKPALIGLLLMAYPYFVPNLWWLYGVGIALTAALFVFRD